MSRAHDFKTSAPWFTDGLLPYVVEYISGSLNMNQSETAHLLRFLNENPDDFRKEIDRCALQFGEEWRNNRE